MSRIATKYFANTDWKLGIFYALFVLYFSSQSDVVFSQSLEIDLGIELTNPDFSREFAGSFEVGLRAGAPAMNVSEGVLVSVVSDMYEANIDEALSFILEEVVREERRVGRAQRYQQSEEFDYRYSANIEYTIGQLYQLKGNRSLAERYYLQAIEKYPSYVSAYIRLMEIYLAQEACDKAIASGKTAIEIGGANGFVFQGFGRCFFLQEDYDAALSAFRVANSFLPDDDSIDYLHAISAMNLGYTEEAITILDELISKHPANSNYYFLQVNAYLQENDNDGALEILEIARRNNILNAASYSLLGNIYVDKQMPEAAAEAYARGLEQDDLPAFSATLQQFDYLSRAEHWQLNEEYLSQITEAYVGRLDDTERLSLQILEARVQINIGQPSNGADLLREVIDNNPTNGDALLSLGRYYHQLQDYERAEIYFQRAASEPEVALSALMDSAQMATDQENWQLAIDHLSRAAEIAPSDTFAVIQENVRAVQRIIEVLD